MKTDLRLKAKTIRKSLPIYEISKKLVGLVRNHRDYIEAENVMLFYPTCEEIDLRELLNDSKCFAIFISYENINSGSISFHITNTIKRN